MHFFKSVVLGALMFGAAVMGAPTAANEDIALDKRTVKCTAYVNMTVSAPMRCTGIELSLTIPYSSVRELDLP